MALIQCPSCGEQISDKATKCVKCGNVIAPEVSNKCVECGSEISVEDTVCSKCGYPIEKNENLKNIPQQFEVTSVKIPKVSSNTKKRIMLFSAFAVILIIGILGFVQIQKQTALTKYSDTYKMAADTMAVGAADSETASNLIYSVWRNAIYEDSDSKTDKFTRPYGYSYVDFNKALNNLFTDSSFISDISGIKKNKENIDALMRELLNPPEEWVEAYSAIQNLYDYYSKMINLAVNPTGNLTSYTSDTNNASTGFVSAYDKVKIYFK